MVKKVLVVQKTYTSEMVRFVFSDDVSVNVSCHGKSSLHNPEGISLKRTSRKWYLVHFVPIIHHNKASTNIKHTDTIYETSSVQSPMTFINKNPTVETTNVAIILAGTPFFRKSTLVR